MDKYFNKSNLCKICCENCPTSDCEGYFVSAHEEYARSFVIPAPYANMSNPEVTLLRGTLFDDLYMPYKICAMHREECCDE